MPSGTVHYKFYKAGFITSIPTTIYMLTISPALGIGNIIGYFCHRWIDNDWDIYSINESESRAVNELWLLGYIIYGVSSSYGAMFRRKHRSFLSHFPIISTFIRLIFLFWWLPILYWNGSIIFHGWQLEFYTGILLGLSQADTYHFFADNIWQEKEEGLELRIFQNKKNKRKLKTVKNKKITFYGKLVRGILITLLGYLYNTYQKIKNRM